MPSRAGEQLSEPLTTVVLLPNSWAAAGPYGVAPSCGEAPLTTRLTVALPGSSSTKTLPLRLGGTKPTGCDPPDPAAMRPHPGQLEPSPVEPLTSQAASYFDYLVLLPHQISLTAPPTARAGSTLRYAVTLTNRAPVWMFMDSLDCPLYEQRIGSAPRTGGTYELRCPSTALKPGQSAVYDMSLNVPADAQLGPTTLTWRFLEPSLPPVTAAITVVR